MFNIKQSKESLKYSPQATTKRCITFSWRYLTTNKKYTFDKFKKDVRAELKARQALSELLIALSKCQWTDITGKRKDDFCGFETLENSSLNFAPSGYVFSNDEKVVIFRFGGNSYRLIGIQDREVLEIIGYDLNHDAYNHG